MNRTQTRNPVIRFLGSLNLTLVILGAFAVAIAAATFLEVRYSTAGARELVYNARWFELLLAFLIVNLIVSLVANWPYPRFKIGFLITHIAFIVVLVSSGITRFFGYEGTMHIREGASTNYLLSDKDHVQVSVGDDFASYPVRLYKPGRPDISETLVVAGEELRAAVEEYWPHFEMRMKEGPGGQPAIIFNVGGGSQTLLKGHSHDTQGVAVHFLSKPRDDVEGMSTTNGDLVIDLGDQHGILPVPREPPAEVEAGGYTFRIIEFAPNFRVGETPSPSDPMDNPAIRVEIETPSGETHTQLLFAYHPEFNMGHTGSNHGLHNVELRYRYGRNLYFYQQTDTLMAVADFELSVGQHQQADGREVPAGEAFEVHTGGLLRSHGFSFMPVSYWQSAVEQPVASDNENMPAAARISVTDASGNRAEGLVTRWTEQVPVELGGRIVTLGFGPIRIPLPYKLHLDDFVLLTYPGSENPASFESHVRLYDEERGIDGQAIRIYMNHPLTYRGFKHFQSSYDQDRRGTILSVNHDPGKWPTYIGYTLLGLGFLITLTRGLIWHRQPNR